MFKLLPSSLSDSLLEVVATGKQTKGAISLNKLNFLWV